MQGCKNWLNTVCLLYIKTAARVNVDFYSESLIRNNSARRLFFDMRVFTAREKAVKR